MRSTNVLLGLTVLLERSLAQYHHHRRGYSLHQYHGHHDARDLDERQVTVTAGSSEAQTVTITDNSRTDTTTIPEIVVFTDSNGKPVSTATAVLELVPPTNSEAALVKERSAGSQAVNSDASHVSRATGSDLFAVAYAPYNADGSCKSASQVSKDLAVIAKTYYMVRVYGVDCGQVPNVYAAAKDNNLKVMWGIFSLDNLGDQIATLTAGVKKDWSNTDTISIGNELVNNGQASAQQVLDAVSSAKELLASAGYSGPVVTVDTFVAALANPQLCKSPSDYCAVNIHAFFDPNTPADQAGVFVANQVQNLRDKLGDSSARVRVCESGWPWQGSANGKAVPGVDQQKTALESIKKAFSSDANNMVLFSAFNDRWKTAAESTFYAEQYWGMGTADAPSA